MGLIPAAGKNSTMQPALPVIDIQNAPTDDNYNSPGNSGMK